MMSLVNWLNQWSACLTERLDKFNANILESLSPTITTAASDTSEFSAETIMKLTWTLAPPTQAEYSIDSNSLVSTRESNDKQLSDLPQFNMVDIFLTAVVSIFEPEVFAIISTLLITLIFSVVFIYSLEKYFRSEKTYVTKSTKEENTETSNDECKEEHTKESNIHDRINKDHRINDSPHGASDASFSLRRQSSNLDGINIEFFDNFFAEEYTVSDINSIVRIQDNFLYGKNFEQEDSLMDIIDSKENLQTNEKNPEIKLAEPIKSSKVILENASPALGVQVDCPQTVNKSDLESSTEWQKSEILPLKPSKTYNDNNKIKRSTDIEPFQTHLYSNLSINNDLSKNYLASRINIDLEEELENNVIEEDQIKEEQEQKSLDELLVGYNKKLDPIIMPIMYSSYPKDTLNELGSMDLNSYQLPTKIEAILQAQEDFDPIDFFEINSDLYLNFEDMDIDSFLEVKFQQDMVTLTIHTIHIFRFLVCNSYEGDHLGVTKYIELIQNNLNNFIGLLNDDLSIKLKEELIYLIRDLITFAADNSISLEELRNGYVSMMNLYISTDNLNDQTFQTKQLISSNLAIIICSISRDSFSQFFVSLLLEKLSSKTNLEETLVLTQFFKYYISFNKGHLCDTEFATFLLKVFKSLIQNLSGNVMENIFSELIIIYLILLETILHNSKGDSEKLSEHKSLLSEIHSLLNPMSKKQLPAPQFD